MTKKITITDKYVAAKVAYNLWCTRDACSASFRPDNLCKKLELLSEEPALNIGTKWFQIGLIKIKDGELVDNDCRLSIFYDDQKIEVMYRTAILGVTSTYTFTI